MREETPISPTWLPEGQGQGALLTQTVAHRTNQRSPKRLEREPQMLPQRGTLCPVPQKACEWEGGHSPTG